MTVLKPKENSDPKRPPFLQCFYLNILLYPDGVQSNRNFCLSEMIGINLAFSNYQDNYTIS